MNTYRPDDRNANHDTDYGGAIILLVIAAVVVWQVGKIVINGARSAIDNGVGGAALGLAINIGEVILAFVIPVIVLVTALFIIVSVTSAIHDFFWHIGVGVISTITCRHCGEKVDQRPVVCSNCNNNLMPPLEATLKKLTPSDLAIVKMMPERFKMMRPLRCRTRARPRRLCA